VDHVAVRDVINHQDLGVRFITRPLFKMQLPRPPWPGHSARTTGARMLKGAPAPLGGRWREWGTYARRGCLNLAKALAADAWFAPGHSKAPACHPRCRGQHSCVLVCSALPSLFPAGARGEHRPRHTPGTRRPHAAHQHRVGRPHPAHPHRALASPELGRSTHPRRAILSPCVCRGRSPSLLPLLAVTG